MQQGRIAEWASRSVQGPLRSLNQDRVLVDRALGLVLVADGLSGRPRGDHAAEVAIATSHTFLAPWMSAAQPPSLEQLAARLREAFRVANDAVLRLGEQLVGHQGTATTLLCAVFTPHHVLVASVGDSRAYRLRHAFLKQVTVDHRVHDGDFTQLSAEERVAVRPLVQLLSRAVGEKTGGVPDVHVELLAPDDVFLFCTNGLSDVLPCHEIAEAIVDSKPLDQACSALAKAALKAGTHDDTTAVLVRPSTAHFGSSS